MRLGVRLIKLDEGDRLVAMAKIDAEEVKPVGDEGAAPAPNDPEPPTDKPETPAPNV